MLNVILPMHYRYIVLLTLLALLAAPSFAQDNDDREGGKLGKGASKGNEPALVQADIMAYNQNLNLIAAKGNVEIAQGNQVLHADKVIYNLNTNVVRAVGNVAILQPSGEVIFANEAELTSDMKQGFVDQLRILFPDNSRLAAQDAQRYEGRYLVADRGVYTACNLCAEHPDEPPLWQVKGVRVTHDSVEHDIMYRDATIEMGGIPVFYTPFFSNPDATVKRRQGLLTPSGGTNSSVGTFFKLPYYIDIAPTDDAILEPVISTKDHLMLSSEWRHRFANGNMQWDGSFTHTSLVNEFGVDEGNQWRGHIFGTSLFNINNEWRAGSNVAYTSDKSYLQRYNIGSDDTLINRGYVEGFRGRNYAVGNLYYFEDLRPGPQKTEPIVAPDILFSALGEPGKTLGGRWSFDGGMLMTTRDRNVSPDRQGPDTRRVDLQAGWDRQIISSTGFLTDVSALARADAYWADNVQDPSLPAGAGFSNMTDIRPFAQSDIKVRYPFGRHGDGYQQIVEPIGVVSVAPQVSNKQKLPNEDSLDVGFDETNLFSPNRFTGVDRLEGGVRTGYGLRHAVIGDNGARIEMLGGQVYRFKRDENFPDGSGLRDQFSDYVGRVEFSPAKWLDTSYGFRLDKSTHEFQRQEAQASAGVPEFRPTFNYINANEIEATTNQAIHIEELIVGFSSKFAKYWTFSASHDQEFLPSQGPRLSRAGIAYSDECFQIGVTAQRQETDRADLNTGTSVMFHFYLKNIGGMHTDDAGGAGYQPPGLMSTPAALGQSQAQP
jgi:LPS-assembly protein